MDILVRHGLLLTMTGEGVGAIEDGAVAIEAGRIIGVGRTQEIERRFPSAEEIIDAKEMAVLPGLVDAHIHTGMTILRGQGQMCLSSSGCLRLKVPLESTLLLITG